MIEFLMGMLTGVVLFYFVLKMILRSLINRLREAIEESDEELGDNNVSARVEEHNGVYYVYNVKDNSFLAQGADMAELRKHITERVKESRVFITEGDVNVIKKLKAELQSS